MGIGWWSEEGRLVIWRWDEVWTGGGVIAVIVREHSGHTVR